MADGMRIRIDDRQGHGVPRPIPNKRGQSRPQQNVPMKQRVTIKNGSSLGKKPHSWGQYGKGYLMRGQETEQSFDREREGVDLGQTMKEWQQAGDRQYHHLVISPEHTGDMSLKNFSRDVMNQMEQDLGKKLEWTAIEHRDTNTPHTHVVIRGVDEQGKELHLSNNYMHYTLRDKAEEMATNQLGYRTNDQVVQRREMTMGREAFTETDRSLLMQMNEQREITFSRDKPESEMQKAFREQEQRRVVYLSSIGLAKQTGEQTWQLRPDLKSELQFRGANREHAPEWREQKHIEKPRERQQQMVRVIEQERTQERGR